MTQESILLKRSRKNGVSGILLAAGESKRMGKLNKLALAVNGIPLIKYMLKQLTDSHLQELIVVLGYHADQAAVWMADPAQKRVINLDYRQGQMSSVHCGLTALTQHYDGVMICLCDLPLLNSDDINVLIENFYQRRKGSILLPTFKGQRGNPIILDYQHRDAILSGQTHLGCKRLIENNPDLVSVMAFANDHVVVDIDTPNDIEKINGRLDKSLTLSANIRNL